MASITSTVSTIGGTPTIFYPLPTPYPSEAGCGTNIYQLTPDSPTFINWDPVYGSSVTHATTCFPAQVTAWWLQISTAATYTALGPTFACPEAYSTMSTNTIATSVQEVYCCPSYASNQVDHDEITAANIPDNQDNLLSHMLSQIKAVLSPLSAHRC